MGKSRGPRRKYDSPEAGKAALRKIYEGIWHQHVEVANPPATLYQYRDENVFRMILESGKLWASDVLGMSDPREIAYPFADVVAPLAAEREAGESKYFLKRIASEDLVREIWGRFQTHITCFSSNADLPSQWRCYANCTGYAIGLNRAALLAWCLARGISLIPMIYEPPLQTTVIREFFEREKQLEKSRCSSKSTATAVRGDAKKYMACFAMTLKAPRFSNEREWRILIIEPNGGARFTRLAREDGVGYFELPLMVPEIVTEIVLGPECHADMSALKSQLAHAGLGNVSIRRANCECGGPQP